jgi:hypothetical protein
MKCLGIFVTPDREPHFGERVHAAAVRSGKSTQ